MKLAFVTSIASNYQDKATVLFRSLRRFYPEGYLVVLMCEEKAKVDIIPELNETGPLVYYPEDYLSYDLDHLKRYNVEEACTAIKPEGLLTALKNISPDIVFYVDPDLEFFSDMSDAIEALQKNDVILTPHLTAPELTEAGIWDNEIAGALTHGIYNLGFIGIRNNPNGAGVLQWWANRLKDFCLAERYLHLWTDQKWMDLVPAYFDRVNIFRHPGYNVAPWNITNRLINMNGDHLTVNFQYNLVFVHFTGFDSGANRTMLERYANASLEIALKLAEEYSAKLKSISFQKKQWTIGLCANGKQITRLDRLDLREHRPMPMSRRSTLRTYIRQVLKIVRRHARIVTNEIKQLNSSRH